MDDMWSLASLQPEHSNPQQLVSAASTTGKDSCASREAYPKCSNFWVPNQKMDENGRITAFGGQVAKKTRYNWCHVWGSLFLGKLTSLGVPWGLGIGDPWLSLVPWGTPKYTHHRSYYTKCHVWRYYSNRFQTNPNKRLLVDVGCASYIISHILLNPSKSHNKSVVSFRKKNCHPTFSRTSCMAAAEGALRFASSPDRRGPSESRGGDAAQVFPAFAVICSSNLKVGTRMKDPQLLWEY